jgi:hypothetical protein
MQVTSVNGFSSSDVLDAPREQQTSVQYVPAWQVPEAGGLARVVEGSTLATQRLLLQVLVVVIVAGALLLLIGGHRGKRSVPPQVKAKRTENKRVCKRSGDKAFSSDTASCPHCGDVIDVGDEMHPRVD